ncbi:MAG: DUF1549 domain-containing protein, partial [Verrucomicrobia bacterium]|nr:DUF1549 domain-containing protein [Verrucomicrobiota bacterium]
MTRASWILIIAISFVWISASKGSSPSSDSAKGSSSGHWAFQRLHKPAPPLSGHPVDAFIRAKHREKGLVFSEQASARELLRRTSLQLTGIPSPSEESLASEPHFSPDHFQSAVSKLLESPRFGERWARWWLDVARYADSNGQDENKFMGQAWRYRDWVISAFNNNLPFDQFALHQIAGDLLPTNNVSIEQQHARLIATGFLVIGPKMLAEQDKPKLVLDIVDEQIDTVGRAFLGLTLQCARCHDHKFDPVTARDYHALAGIFKSTRTMKDLAFVSSWNERSISTDVERAALRTFQDATNKIAAEIRSAEESANQEVHQVWRSKASAYARASAEWRSLEAASRTTNAAGWIASKADLHLPTLERWTSHNSDGALAWMERDVQSIAEEAWTLWSSTEARVFLSPGRLGSAGRFKGQASLIETHSPELEPSSLTLQVWVRPLEIPMGDNDRRRWLIGKNDNEWAQGHYSLFLEGTTAGAYLNIGGGPDNVIITRGAKNSVPPNHWTFLAMTYDGSELKLYTNGFLASATRPSKPRGPGTGNFAIGKRGDGHRFFQGDLDQAALYSRARDEKEIAEAFHRPEDGSEKPNTGL